MPRAFWKYLDCMGSVPRYILTRCLWLCALSELGALLLGLAAGPCSPATYSVLLCADALRDGGLILFGTGLIGSALAEDVFGGK